jgi:hypothetical protein
MSLSDDVKTAMTGNVPLMVVLTGGVYNDVEEISRQNPASAFDANGEIKPCALIKVPNEVPAGPYLTSVRTTFVIYFYQRQGYAAIESAMGMAFALLNEQRIGAIWNVEYVSGVYQQRDQSLDCALGSLRFNAVRKL